MPLLSMETRVLLDEHRSGLRAMIKGSGIGSRAERPQRGSALLVVLWLSAALSAIAFSVATTVRTETGRTSTLAEGVRTYYLAAGGIERIRLYVNWGAGYRNPDGTAKYFEPGMSR